MSVGSSKLACMPIDPPTDEDRDRLDRDLRDRAALVRGHGWEPYENVWSTGEVLGVRAVLGEPGALDASVELWAPALWGIAGAELDANLRYDLTRRWFAATANPAPEELTDTEKAR